MTPDDQKREAARAALAYVQAGATLGVGTGSTVAHFIAALAAQAAGDRPSAAVASSEATAVALLAAGIPVVRLEAAPLPLPVYVDGADEVDPELRLIKGGGGAHAREKVLAAASRLFVCIVDESKLVERLGAFPVPVEVVPMATPLVAASLREMGGRPVPRPDYLTDNRNVVLDVSGLDLSDPEGLEIELDAVPGVVECGVFARRRADVVLIGGDPVRRVTPVRTP